MSTNIAAQQSVSQILTNSRNQKNRLSDILQNVINLRIQLDGEFPTDVDKEVAGKIQPGLVGAILGVQSTQDDIIDAINVHMDVIHEKLGMFYHPCCEDEVKDDQGRL